MWFSRSWLKIICNCRLLMSKSRNPNNYKELTLPLPSSNSMSRLPGPLALPPLWQPGVWPGLTNQRLVLVTNQRGAAWSRGPLSTNPGSPDGPHLEVPLGHGDAEAGQLRHAPHLGRGQRRAWQHRLSLDRQISFTFDTAW